MPSDPDPLDIDVEVEVYSQPHYDKLRDIVVEALRIVRYEPWKARNLAKKARGDLNSVTQDENTSLKQKRFRFLTRLGA